MVSYIVQGQLSWMYMHASGLRDRGVVQQSTGITGKIQHWLNLHGQGKSAKKWQACKL